MTLLVVVVIVGAVLAAWAADRLIKARASSRRVRQMRTRLDAATRRADEQQHQRKVSDRASAALTSFLPAIKSPPLQVPGSPAQASTRPAAGRPGRADHAPTHPGSARPGRRPARTGEHGTRSGPRRPAP